ncbi:hypothetical protein DWZ56_14530 [Lachnotalea sp. AF33-28]|jgi:hypothetical protein|nr:hypothetical protein DWZ56_14530 [Lachnotalea sp. AF33-28]
MIMNFKFSITISNGQTLLYIKVQGCQPESANSSEDALCAPLGASCRQAIAQGAHRKLQRVFLWNEKAQSGTA